MKSQSVVTDNLEVFAVVTENWEVCKVKHTMCVDSGLQPQCFGTLAHAQ